METTLLHRDGTAVTVEMTLVPVHDSEGRIVSLAGALRDVSAQKRADAERGLARDELAHRLRNKLATVQSIALQTLRGATSLDAFRTAFSARLTALSHSHDLVMSSADHMADFRKVVEIELTPYSDLAAVNWSAVGPDVALTPTIVLPLTMIVHELTTNAAKHGAIARADGRVDVQWTLKETDGAPRLKVVWAESGGPPVGQVSRKGFGTRLISDCVSSALGGELIAAYHPAGLRCEFDIPLGAPRHAR